MAGLPPTYNEVTTGVPEETTAYPEKTDYPPEKGGYPTGDEQEFERYPPQPNAHQPLETAYPPQPQEQYPYVQQPYPITQQPSPYPQQTPAQYPQGYVPPPSNNQDYPQSQPANVTVTTTAQQGRDVQFSGGSGSFIGIIVLTVISICCCLPFGIFALVLAVLAYREYTNDRNSQKAVRYSRIATALGISSIVLGIIGVFLGFFLGIISAVVVSINSAIR